MKGKLMSKKQEQNQQEDASSADEVPQPVSQDEEKQPTHKFSLYLRVNDINPAHVFFTLFAGMIPAEIDHERGTRANCGDLRLRRIEFIQFLDRIHPDLIAIKGQEVVSVDDLKIRVKEAAGRFGIY